MPPTITVPELARRLCVAAKHPNAINPPQPPCPHHITEANRFWGLTQPNGQSALSVIQKVVAENGGPWTI